MKNAIVLSESANDFALIARCLGAGFHVSHCRERAACLSQLEKAGAEFVFIDYGFLEGARWVVEFKAQFRPYWHACHGVEIIMLCDQEFMRGAVYAVIGGAYNYLTHPLNPDELRFVLDSFVEQHQIRLELDFLRDELWQLDSRDLVTVASPAMKEVIRNAKAVAPTNSTVLITGETGSGKSVLARLIHKHSQRREGPFVSIHCSAIPDTLLESELFGHERGAFTGAIRRKMGKFEAAHGGTIFLDEIGTIPPATQIKLLQVLQERTFSRVGGEDMVETDVRIIAATNASLPEMIAAGTFRGDLYYRLNVFPITVPPLRQRKADIPLLVEFFLMKLNEAYFKEIRDVHPVVREAFKTYTWPGNIRELENLIERAYILETTPMLRPEVFPAELFNRGEYTFGTLVDTKRSLKEVRDQCVAQVESAYLRQLLEDHDGRIKDTAEAAGLGVRQLHKLLVRHGIDKANYRQGPRKRPTHDRPRVNLPRIPKPK